jgi:Holliday junction resolvase RusA-like endonuclease
MVLKYIIPLDPRTKKNHQMIAGSGERCPYCGKFKKMFIRQGKANTEYTAKAWHYLTPKPAVPISSPVQIRYLFYMATRRKVDALNLCAAADDLLAEAGILADDNTSIIKSHDGTRVLYDKEHPRTEIYITDFQEGP